MNAHSAQRPSCGDSKHISPRDLAIALLAIAGVVFANVGVVRALDIALDAIHR
ncbi:hypothetical protein [Methylocystis parvus]|uniref:hypothetical protein n=1 Tax=Methylocystis parvus TaxID=134 RepID=UPI0002FA6CBC|nr:hypothetical protein [Methylocystis parvus]WBJ99212.1 hypothetical protein MMG94_14570 [Methylocystis parvus OBBP]